MVRTTNSVDKLVSNLQDMATRKWEEPHASVDHIVQSSAAQFKDDAVEAAMCAACNSFGEKST